MYRLFFAWVVLGSFAHAQVEARFALPKEKYLSGEPILLEYTVRNTGTQPVTILSANPNSFCSGYVVKVNRTDVTEPHGCGGGFGGGSCMSSGRPLEPVIDMIGDSEESIQTASQSALVQLTHHAFNPKQIVPSDTPAAHAAWIRWWSRNGESAPIYKPGEYCGNAAPLD